MWEMTEVHPLHSQSRGPSASQLTAATVMDVIPRPPDCAGQAADAVIRLHSGKMEHAPTNAQNSESRMMDTSSTTQVAKVMVKHWSCAKFVLLASCSKESFQKSSIQTRWGKVPNWECFFVHRKQRLFLSGYVDDMKFSGRTQNLSPMRKKLMK